MTNYIRKILKGHPFHLASPSPGPILTCMTLLSLTASGILIMHLFKASASNLFIALLSVVLPIMLFFLCSNIHKDYSKNKYNNLFKFIVYLLKAIIIFFIFALLFLLFDLEILLIYPYIVSSYIITIYGLVIMLRFIILLTLGFTFELGKKALNIESKQLNIMKYFYTLRIKVYSNIILLESRILMNPSVTFIVGIILYLVVYFVFLMPDVHAMAPTSEVGDGFTAHRDGTYTIATPHPHGFVPNVNHMTNPPYVSNQPFASDIADAMEHSDNVHRAASNWSHGRPEPINASKYGVEAERFINGYLQYYEARGPNHIYKNTAIVREAFRHMP